MSQRLEPGKLVRQRVKEQSRLLPQKAIDIMMNWYSQNYENPYPTYRDCETLAAQGNIEVKQVKQWFINIRRRTHNENRRRRNTTSDGKCSSVKLEAVVDYSLMSSSMPNHQMTIKPDINYQSYVPNKLYVEPSNLTSNSNLLGVNDVSTNYVNDYSSGYLSQYNSPQTNTHSIQNSDQSYLRNSSTPASSNYTYKTNATQFQNTANYWNDSNASVSSPYSCNNIYYNNPSYSYTYNYY